MAQLVLGPDGEIKTDMYLALKNTLTLDDALDLVEIDEVGRSWRAAERRNEDEINRIIQARGSD